MTSNYAKSPKNVLFIVYPDIVLLDLVGPLQVFTHARREDGSPPAYQTHVLSLKGGQTPTNTVVSIPSEPLATWVNQNRHMPIHTIVAVGGDGVMDAVASDDFIASFKTLAARARRVCSVCSGAFILAKAGLLDDRRAVTHWEDCDLLARSFPKVNVEVDPIYVKDGHIWTSAGITAGIDMSLAIIEEDLGKPAAIAMARSLVTPMVRSGGQSQFSAELARQANDSGGRFSALHHWMSDNIGNSITVEDMAHICGMSSRNFSRKYTEVMGTPPAKALEAMRVEMARTLLETSDRSIKAIAANCGFMDDERMRRAFLRTVHTTPSEYRKQFQFG